VLKLMFASLLRASKTWQRVVMTEFEVRQIDDLRNESRREVRATINVRRNDHPVVGSTARAGTLPRVRIE
jgi:hypothetical protein